MGQYFGHRCATAEEGTRVREPVPFSEPVCRRQAFLQFANVPFALLCAALSPGRRMEERLWAGSLTGMKGRDRP